MLLNSSHAASPARPALMRRLLLALALLCLSALGHAASANTLTVPAQYATIQAAINAAVSGDTVLISDGTYTGPGNVDLDFGGRNITVTSVNGPASTVIDCGGSSSANHRGFNLHSKETNAVISGLTIENGYMTTPSNDPDSTLGGGICIDESGATVQNCVFKNNTAGYGGGGVYNANGGVNPIPGPISVSYCTFIGNTAGSGGGIYDLMSGSPASLISVTNCILIGNSAGVGGGILNDDSESSGMITVTDCTLAGNSAPHGVGGGIDNYNSGNSPITLTNCTLTGNTSSGSGEGGGIFNYGYGSITLTNCALNGNSAGTTGGGICNGDSGPISMTNCTLTGNTARNGGGIYSSLNAGLAASITMTNCTLTGNTAISGGASYNYNQNSGPITLTNNVFYGDTGGEIVNDPNTTSNATATYCDIQGGYSGTNNLNANPLFTSPATGDVHLRPGSPCIGDGVTVTGLTTDKDGTARPTPPSIGAYELGSTLLVPGQYATIQAAINAAHPGNTVLISDGTYTGPGDVDLDFGGKSLTVTSVNGAAKTILNCQGTSSANHRGFTLHSGETNAALSGLTIENGYENGNGGGVETGNGATVTLADCLVEGSTAGFGGGISTGDGTTPGTATLIRCTLTGNAASGGGGGICNVLDTVGLTNCTITGNSGPLTYAQGGGVLNSGTMTLTGCTVTGNSDSAGGGLYNYSNDTLTLTACTVSNNTAAAIGGGVDNDGYLTLTDCLLTGNTAGSLSLNRVGNGGGGYNTGVATLTNCALSGNSAPNGGDGGGLYNYNGGGTGSEIGSLTLTNCTLTGNAASNASGGLYDNLGALTLTNDILYGDTGGEIALNQGTAAVIACDVQGGYAGGGNLNAAPLFVSATDLHLQPGSPCLGAGTAHGTPTTTLDGYTRPNPPAIGAYELKPATPTTVTVVNATGSAGQTVTLSATLKTTGGAALSGRTLTFSVDGAAVGVGVTNTSGVAVKAYVVPATLTVGTHVLAAAFAGDAGDAASSGAATLTVTKANTTLSIGTAVGSPGQSVTLKATLKRVSGGTPVAGETVTFTLDGTSVGTAVTTGAGLASLPYVIPAGDAIGSSHPVAAAFAGDGSYNASSGASTLTVSKYAMSLSVAAVTGTPGQTVALSATLKRTVGGAAVAGETVTFTVDGAAAGTGVTNAAGVATLAFAIPGGANTGSHAVTASFAGDAANAAALGKGALTVKNAAALAVADASGARGTSVTLSATLTLAGAASAGKTVTFKVNGVSAGTAVTNSAGVASVTYAISATAKPGSLPIAASFAGDAADNPAVGAGTLTVR